MNQQPARVAVIGLGYFSQFHLTAWTNSSAAQLVGICDSDATVLGTHTERLASTGLRVKGYTDATTLVHETRPDIIDIVAPPTAHAALIRQVLEPQTMTTEPTNHHPWLICQKPFCTDLTEAETLACVAANAGARLAIHENFRFQPWYRTLKDIIDTGTLGQIYQCRFTLRPGDGRGADAYLARQPTFQTMKQFLVRETGVHFLDLFRWLFGNVADVYADLRQLNPAIAGEDAGLLIMNHTSGTVSIFDGNRLQDHRAENHRLTMGELQLESEAATLRIDGFGRLWQRRFHDNNETQIPLTYPVADHEFGGGCVAALIEHVITAWHNRHDSGNQQQDPGHRVPMMLENEINDYLPVIRLSDACYQSAQRGTRITL